MAQNSFNENSLITVPYLSYSPDLTQSDFWPFGQIKTSLTGCVFSDVDEPLEVVIELLNEIQLSELRLSFHH